MARQKIIVIVGPTASGKSDLAIKLAQKFNGEIISADSRQVYRDLDIGTGKVTKYEQLLVRHHLIDVTSPKKVFTVSDFKSRAERAITGITLRSKLPIIVGGTGLYIDALIYDIQIPEVPPNKLLRLNLNKLSAEELFRQLSTLDPRRAKTIDRHNKRRLIRALEIIDSLGSVPLLSTNYSLHSLPYSVLWLGLNSADLEKRIASRLTKRFKQGLIAEVKNLHKQGLSYKRLDDLGLEYRWAGQYLQDKITKEEMFVGLERAICQYAKRQITWFKRNKKIRWLAPSKVEGIKSQASALVKKFLV